MEKIVKEKIEIMKKHDILELLYQKQKQIKHFQKKYKKLLSMHIAKQATCTSLKNNNRKLFIKFQYCILLYSVLKKHAEDEKSFDNILPSEDLELKHSFKKLFEFISNSNTETNVAPNCTCVNNKSSRKLPNSTNFSSGEYSQSGSFNVTDKNNMKVLHEIKHTNPKKNKSITKLDIKKLIENGVSRKLMHMKKLKMRKKALKCKMKNKSTGKNDSEAGRFVKVKRMKIHGEKKDKKKIIQINNLFDTQSESSDMEEISPEKNEDNGTKIARVFKRPIKVTQKILKDTKRINLAHSEKNEIINKPAIQSTEQLNLQPIKNSVDLSAKITISKCTELETVENCKPVKNESNTINKCDEFKTVEDCKPVNNKNTINKCSELEIVEDCKTVNNERNTLVKCTELDTVEACKPANNERNIIVKSIELETVEVCKPVINETNTENPNRNEKNLQNCTEQICFKPVQKLTNKKIDFELSQNSVNDKTVEDKFVSEDNLNKSDFAELEQNPSDSENMDIHEINMESNNENNHENISDLIIDLIDTEWDEDFVNTSIGKLTRGNTQEITKIIIDEILEDSQDVDRTYTPPAPLLTVTQQKLLTIIYHTQQVDKKIINSILSTTKNKILFQATIITIDPLTRLFVALCKLDYDIQSVRILCCDAAFYLTDLFVPFMYTVLTMWAEVLPLASEVPVHHMAHAIAQIINFKKCHEVAYKLTKVKDILKNYYGFYKEQTKILEMFKNILDIYLENKSEVVYSSLVIIYKNLSRSINLNSIAPKNNVNNFKTLVENLRGIL